jgi:hypothetical protein
MRHLVGLAALASLLALAASAGAGGWAAVTLGSTPAGVGAGDTWTAEITVLRHGVTPTDGATPSVIIRNQTTGAERTFAAEPAGATGVYEAQVVFPEAGTWGYAVDNGLAATGYGVSQTTEFPPVTISGGSSRVGDDGSFPASPLLAVLGAALLLAAAGLVGARRLRRLTPASR